MRPPKLRALCEILRIRLLPSAWADILAGACLAGGAWAAPHAAAMVVSSGLYLFGMATNALLDFEADRVLYPARPLPSGRLGRVHAWAAAAVLLGIACGGAAGLAPAARWNVMAILGAILAYNGGLKRVAVLGPLLMGSCRFMNLLLGALAAGVPDAIPWWAASALGLYTAGVTWISRLEGRTVPRARLAALVLLLAAIPAGLVPLTWGLGTLPLLAHAALIACALPARGFTAGKADERLVHRLLAGIYLLDASFLARAGSAVLSAAACVAAAATLAASRTGRPPQQDS